MANGHHLDEGDQLAAGGQQHRSAALLQHLLRAGLQEYLVDGQTRWFYHKRRLARLKSVPHPDSSYFRTIVLPSWQSGGPRFAASKMAWHLIRTGASLATAVAGMHAKNLHGHCARVRAAVPSA